MCKTLRGSTPLTASSGGAQVYDLVAGGQGLTISRYMTPTESRRQFPTLAEHGPNDNELKGTVRPAASLPPCSSKPSGCAAPGCNAPCPKLQAGEQYQSYIYPDYVQSSHLFRIDERLWQDAYLRDLACKGVFCLFVA